jgi:CheY-like chemotaxis protein/anti-sigma regulatory factor (Ser/Thr protein kinase)
VSGDGQRLQQVFWNLLSNAIKFTPKGGRVQVTLSHVDSQVELTVADTGQGIKPEFLPHVFERFRQADNTTTRVHGGLGLGLAIVRHIVELHGGAVQVASEGVGRGATFTVTLPVAAVQPSAGERPQPPPLTRVPYAPSAELSGIRVLVVDDDQDTLEMLELVLRQAGADVRIADSAGAGFRTFREWHPHVVVSDIGMPGEDGYAFINKVRGLPREDGGQTPAIALTAYARSEDRVRVLSAGFQMHVAKPIEPAELVASLASIRGWTGTTH